MYGWGDSEFGCFDNIIMHESKWSITATNPTSGAYGIPQALPGSKMATAGADWKTNPATQITWALGYVKARYSPPCGAGRGHLAAGQCLRDAVRPRGRVRRRDAPLRLVHDDVVEALELGVTPAVRVGHQLAGDLAGIGRRRVVALRLPLLLRLQLAGGLADLVGLCAQLGGTGTGFRIDVDAIDALLVDVGGGDGCGHDLRIGRDGPCAGRRTARHRRHSGDDGESQSDRVAHLHVPDDSIRNAFRKISGEDWYLDPPGRAEPVSRHAHSLLAQER